MPSTIPGWITTVSQRVFLARPYREPRWYDFASWSPAATFHDVYCGGTGTSAELWGSCTGEHETFERLEQSILDQPLGEKREDHT